eukprot:TRINITY_DN6050_c0_g1_i1.p1 TRINITY_DN6050_c0_g1~~TRINITY_DN6050_c0_g1_i1.p1  ORF type:complete len:294 (-),score=37.13 TRINITY_DN6050_c0_g1_i1:426-1307(-)
MVEEKGPSLTPRTSGDRDQLIHLACDPEEANKAGPSQHTAYYQGREALVSVLQSWASRKFMSGCVILFPIAITFYITYWFIMFFDGFFSPIYRSFGVDIIGLGFVTSIVFIFFVGILVSSWIGASILWTGEWLIKRMPLVKHIYSATKQVGQAISPGDVVSQVEQRLAAPSYGAIEHGNGRNQNSQAFKEVAIIRHPRHGEYAFGFITSSLTLAHESGEEELCSVYVPTNHLYIGDIILMNLNDIMRPNLSVREGIEIVVSGGMTMPSHITFQEHRKTPNRTPRGIGIGISGF